MKCFHARYLSLFRFACALAFSHLPPNFTLRALPSSLISNFWPYYHIPFTTSIATSIMPWPSRPRLNCAVTATSCASLRLVFVATAPYRYSGVTHARRGGIAFRCLAQSLGSPGSVKPSFVFLFPSCLSCAGEKAVWASKHNAAGYKPYSVFTHREKVFIVTISSFAALFR